MRCRTHIQLALRRSDCEIAIIADLDPIMRERALQQIAAAAKPKPKVYGRGDDDYLRLLSDSNIDAVVISSP